MRTKVITVVVAVLAIVLLALPAQAGQVVSAGEQNVVVQPQTQTQSPCNCGKSQSLNTQPSVSQLPQGDVEEITPDYSGFGRDNNDDPAIGHWMGFWGWRILCSGVVMAGLSDECYRVTGIEL